MSTLDKAKYIAWKDVEREKLNPLIDREMVVGSKVMLARVLLKKGAHVPLHHHHNEQVTYILDGALKFSIDGKEIVVSGWSAGGHLTAMALSHPFVRAGLGISGIYELEPIRHSYLNVKLNLDEAASRRNSPLMAEGGPAKPLSLVVGSAELPLLRKQTADFAAHRARHGLPVTYEEIPGADHFTIMNELSSPMGRITTLIRQLFARTG